MGVNDYLDHDYIGMVWIRSVRITGCWSSELEAKGYQVTGLQFQDQAQKKKKNKNKNKSTEKIKKVYQAARIRANEYCFGPERERLSKRPRRERPLQLTPTATYSLSLSLSLSWPFLPPEETSCFVTVFFFTCGPIFSPIEKSGITLR
ncbi:hypothetical protein CIPAW_09G223800 [Carya illinoinensis]|uniref:Uncharacterized protein n=1 Tax=Carya illinoinensis TaxID=32201 RepID=A0A8T1PNY0_CARIL|nr:hypothetical protein CIPAW_09G223800 [Carya illinoinensis]